MVKSFPIPFVFYFLLAVTILPSLSRAADEIILKHGDPVKGEIHEIDALGNVKITFSKGTLPFPLATIDSVKLEERPGYRKGVTAFLKNDYATAVTELKPLVDKFLGLRVEWVVSAAGYLAEALGAQKKTYEAEEIGKKILALYKGSEYELKGLVVSAKVAYFKDEMQEALRLVDEILKKLPNEAIPRNDVLMGLMSDMIFLKAQVYEKLGQKQDALENYLKVATIYYKPKERAMAAQAKADKLCALDKKLVVK